ncbi:LysR family transcriptional regulator [Acidovorax sp. LjRoot118]|jgi:DNA-binding transcriptional LysR family regulator|uniref:LysR family transcriptional regulator n=1 Tax=unclassified Acidovorax TaxID=2684926 RepID=UPI0007090B06|nr:LysR family transcriptional regulator [Acidovorax sp. Root219]KRC24695.1 LysR family transcriptional regulator [Acidovorax sp. Root219]
MQDLDPLAGITVFVTTAHSDNFTQAADRLGLTKSAVGKSIARLEDRLGAKLFHRTTRLTRLTADGEAYLAACTSAMQEITAAQATLSSGNPVLKGRVHIDMPVAFGRRVVLPALVQIARPHPGLQLSLTFTDATSDLLADDVDIAIRFGALKDTGHLVARRLATQPRVICASPGYLREHGEPTHLAEIAGHRCVVGALRGPPMVWFVRDQGVEKRITPPATHQISDGEAMVDAALQGLGLAQLPISMVRDQVGDGRLRLVLHQYAGSQIDIHAIWPQRAHLSPRVRYIVDGLVACAAQGRFN